jgi:hypothetical protein
MTKQDIIDQIKEIVVDQCELDPDQRQWFAAFGALIDKIEDSIEDEEEDWFLNEVPWEEYFNNGRQA